MKQLETDSESYKGLRYSLFHREGAVAVTYSQGHEVCLERPRSRATPDCLTITDPLLRSFTPLKDACPSAPDWTEAAIHRIGEIATPQDKLYAEMAARHVSSLLSSKPRIYNAPEGGIIIEHRNNVRILTIMIEQELGLIITTSDDFIVTGEFKLSQDTISEFLSRYFEELYMLENPPGGPNFAEQESGA